MNCQRAIEALAGLAANRPAFTAAEIEELLAHGLAVEADPRDMATLQWLVPVVQDHAGCAIEDPEAPLKLGVKLGEITDQLKSDWYRFTTGKETLALREQERHALRRAIAVLHDPTELARLVKILADGRQGGNARYAACEALGSEIYAITPKGVRVSRELELRVARFAAQSLSAFLSAFDKSERKMEAFSGDIATLADGISPVKKNRHQVVIGLAKTGAPPSEALGLYRQTMRATAAPDVAVTCARNAAAHGGPQQVAHRLKLAQEALRGVGLTMTPAAMGAAKTLLPFEQVETGALRFAAIAQLLEAQNLTRGDATIKGAARLMPAAGTPQDIVQRTLTAHGQLPEGPDHEARTSTAIALASMVHSEDAVAPLAQRFLELYQELVRRKVSAPPHAASDALECVACPGTPAEVAGTVRTLAWKVARQHEPQRSDVAIAVAFAKRFAY
jgi:hypothetical protein